MTSACFEELVTRHIPAPPQPACEGPQPEVIWAGGKLTNARRGPFPCSAFSFPVLMRARRDTRTFQKGAEPMPRALLLIVVILLLLAVLPTWPHSVGWGYYPSGGLGLILIIIIVLLLVGAL